MQHIPMALAATLIGAAFVASSPSPASASARDHVKARQPKRIQACCQKKAQGVVEKAQRLVKSKEQGDSRADESLSASPKGPTA